MVLEMNGCSHNFINRPIPVKSIIFLVFKTYRIQLIGTNRRPRHAAAVRVTFKSYSNRDYKIDHFFFRTQFNEIAICIIVMYIHDSSFSELFVPEKKMKAPIHNMNTDDYELVPKSSTFNIRTN